ncbi:SDR family NAD(P)-dependent oxidoreductase [Amycolatopsis tolypomycina]|uniref:SDR family NAD(P)-dependent oxidoreductase n=1 Tax=Amycolatopsis tolypomycina TaxID=208445 RepID=UPI0033A9D19A
MFVAVTGGTGFLGAHTVRALLRHGHRVRLLARRPDRVAAALAPLGIAPEQVDVVPGDVTDPAAAARLVSGVDGLLHAAGVYTFDPRRRAELRRVNEHGTEVVLAAARAAGVARIVHVSTVGTLYPAAAPSIGPGTPPGSSREPYLASKTAAERIAGEYGATITRPPALLGPHDPHLGDQNARLRDLLRGLMPLWPTGGLPLGDVRDNAELHARLFDGVDGTEFFGPGTFVTTREYLAAVREVTGRRLPAAFFPARALTVAGRAADVLQRCWPGRLPVQYGAIHVCAVAVPVEPAAPSAGVVARPLAETLADTVRWLAGSGALAPRRAGRAVAGFGAAAGVPARPAAEVAAPAAGVAAQAIDLGVPASVAEVSAQAAGPGVPAPAAEVSARPAGVAGSAPAGVPARPGASAAGVPARQADSVPGSAPHDREALSSTAPPAGPAGSGATGKALP